MALPSLPASVLVRCGGFSVAEHRLDGRLILVVEDEPLVSLDIVKALRAVGASVLSAGYAESALCTTEHPRLAAAVVDLHLGDGSGMAICKRLQERGLPFVIYTGYPPMVTSAECADAPVIIKPAPPGDIIRALVGLLH
jgi:ActR/RegA family two-component response regulator